MTLAVLAITAILLIIYDIFIVLVKGVDQTISWQTWLISQKHPVIPFALGFVMGHLLWVQTGV